MSKGTTRAARTDAALRLAIVALERLGAPEGLLQRGYRLAISLAIFRGWRSGIERWRGVRPAI